MSRQHLAHLAQALKECKPPDDYQEALNQWWACVQAVARVCEYHAPLKFKEWQFYQACGYTEGREMPL